MAPEGRDVDDEIDLVALVLLFWGHRGKFAALAVTGMILGLAFTYQHAPRYATDFKVALGHPMYSEVYWLSPRACRGSWMRVRSTPMTCPASQPSPPFDLFLKSYFLW